MSPRKPAKRYPPVYLPGDCLAVELSDGTFGAALVLAADDRHATEGFDVVALLEWRSADRPPLDWFATAARIRPNEDGRLIPVVRRCYASSHPPVSGRIGRVGQLPRFTADTAPARFLGRWQELVSDLEHHYGLRS